MSTGADAGGWMRIFERGRQNRLAEHDLQILMVAVEWNRWAALRRNDPNQ